MSDPLHRYVVSLRTPDFSSNQQDRRQGATADERVCLREFWAIYKGYFDPLWTPEPSARLSGSVVFGVDAGGYPGFEDGAGGVDGRVDPQDAHGFGVGGVAEAV